MRSVFAVAAAVWFLNNALTFVPQGSGVIPNPGQVGGLDAVDGGAVAVTWAARTLFAGLVPLSLSLVAWEKVLGLFTRGESAADAKRAVGPARPPSESGRP
jgi:hypothetical protein